MFVYLLIKCTACVAARQPAAAAAALGAAQRCSPACLFDYALQHLSRKSPSYISFWLVAAAAAAAALLLRCGCASAVLLVSGLCACVCVCV